MLPSGVSDSRFSDTAGFEIYRHSRSSFCCSEYARMQPFYLFSNLTL
jgi:hypothetical protein